MTYSHWDCCTQSSSVLNRLVGLDGMQVKGCDLGCVASISAIVHACQARLSCLTQVFRSHSWQLPSCFQIPQDKHMSRSPPESLTIGRWYLCVDLIHKRHSIIWNTGQSRPSFFPRKRWSCSTMKPSAAVFANLVLINLDFVWQPECSLEISRWRI